MITNKREQKICLKYGSLDANGHVHCFECPLRKCDDKNEWDFRCKANSSYNRHTREWEYDRKEYEYKREKAALRAEKAESKEE